MKFWDRAKKCKHENISSNYNIYIPCSTQYCEGSEFHCLDCGVYISECHCMAHNGMSGWSNKKWKTYYKKQQK